MTDKTETENLPFEANFNKSWDVDLYIEQKDVHLADQALSAYDIQYEIDHNNRTITGSFKVMLIATDREAWPIASPYKKLKEIPGPWKTTIRSYCITLATFYIKDLHVTLNGDTESDANLYEMFHFTGDLI